MAYFSGYVHFKFGCAFLLYSWVSKIALLFLNFLASRVRPEKKCVVFIGCNFESRASLYVLFMWSVGLARHFSVFWKLVVIAPDLKMMEALKVNKF